MATLNTYYYRVLPPQGRVRSGVLRMAVKRELSARMRIESDTDGTVLELVALSCLACLSFWFVLALVSPPGAG